MIVLYVALGGAAGAVARYGVGGWIHGVVGPSFPWGTFVVNVVGSFLLGFSVAFLDGLPVGPETRAMVTVGFLGAFTTFSTYSYETVALLRGGEWTRGVLYSLGSLTLGLLGVLLGVAAGALLLRVRG